MGPLKWGKMARWDGTGSATPQPKKTSAKAKWW